MLPGEPPSWPAPDPGARAGGAADTTAPITPAAPRRRSPWGWVVVAVLVAAGAGIAAWLWVRADDSGTVSAPATSVVASVATTTPAAATVTTTAASPAPRPSTTAAAITPAPAPAPTPAPTAATPPPATPPPASASIVPGVGTTPADAPALTAAQAVSAALAAGDWSAVRRLSPDEGRTDAQLQEAYGAVTDVAIVPARIERSNGVVDLRLGLVAHEDDPGGPATALLCAHWKVDQAAGTVDRISSVRLRLEPGRIDPMTVAPELARTCATYPLR